MARRWRAALAALVITRAAEAWQPSNANGSRDGAKWFLDMLEPNETRLLWQSMPWAGSHGGGGSGANASVAKINETACDGRPYLLTRSEKANGFCPERFTQVNASCTCVEMDKKADSVEFRVSARGKRKNGEMRGSVGLETTLSVSSIGAFSVPPTLRSLSIIGEETKQALAIPIAQSKRWNGAGQLSLLWNSDSAKLASVTIANIDLTNVANSEMLLPATITNLSLRNCNIPGFNVALIQELGNLVALDLSSNNLAEPYERPQIQRCVTGLCQLRSLNLSNNKFTSLPQSISFYDSLTELDLSGNPITNFTVPTDVFSRLASLQGFYLSASATDCDGGTIQSVHSIALCVVDPSSTRSTTDASSSTTTNQYLVYTVIGAGILVVVLVGILAWQLVSHRRDGKEYHHFPFAMGTTAGALDTTAPTSNFDETFYNTGTATILNDPIIITRRIEQSDIKIAACISTGGFGVVYSGVYRRRRRVAVKKIRPEYNTNNEMIERFLKEICLMATLRHPRIVEFIGVAWHSPRDLCAVTELMEKGDVREVLHHQRKKHRAVVTWENGKKHSVALHVAEALVYLHSLAPKVIHRDLKAKNVLLNAKLEAKLSDFGIARQVEELHMTKAIGTSFWIAPEVLLGSHDYDERADIYSFGIVLCEIDTEDYPFQTPENSQHGSKVTELAILREVAKGALRPEFSETCPMDIREVARRCLETDPASRPTAVELVELLQASAGLQLAEEEKVATESNVNRRRASLQGRGRGE